MSAQRVGFAAAAGALIARDLRLALRRSGDTLQPLGFFLVVTALFPLALDPQLSLLRDIAPAALWVGALLSSLLALDLLFREDAQDGALEQLALCGLPFQGLLLAKTAVHWLLTGLPLVLIAPLAAIALGAPYEAMPGILSAVLLGTLALSLIGAVGAGLTMSLKRNASANIRRARDCSGDCRRTARRAAVPAGSTDGAQRDAGAVGAGGRGANRSGIGAYVNVAWVWFHRFGSPPHFYRLATRLTPWFAWPAGLLCLWGLIGGLLLAPPDYQQHDGFRIIYVHAPAAWLSLMVYVVMAASAAVGLIWRMTVAYAVSASCAVIGASFTALALVTGMLYGRPMWGTYWEWDPRLTSELLLLFLYLGYLGLRNAIDDVGRADRASAVLAIVGVVNVPIIHYSVIWWHSLHQAPTVMKFGRPSMPASMLVPLLLMLAGFTAYFVALLLIRARGELLRRERNARWIAEALGAPAMGLV
jgi:heme exporter protein C